MKADKPSLAQVLSSILKNQRLVNESLDRLNSLFEAANRGKFELTKPGWLDGAETCQAIARATNEPVKEAFILSLSAAGGAADRLTPEERYRLGQGMKVGDSLWGCLWDRHHYAMRTRLDAKCGVAFRQRLELQLRASLMDPLYDAFQATVAGSRLRNHAACIWNGIWDAVLTYVVFVAAGETARAAQLAPLVRLLGKVWPLYRREEAPESWIVVAA